MQILKSEQDTVVDVARSQCLDIERYLDKEVTILNDVIQKQSLRQKAEYSRLNEQIVDVRNIRQELDNSRIDCVKMLVNVEDVLGITTASNE